MRGLDDDSVRRLVQWAMVQFGCEVAMIGQRMVQGSAWMVQMTVHMA